MDSEGIWNACTMKVMTNTAMMTVASKDCSELKVSACGRFSLTSMTITVECGALRCRSTPLPLDLDIRAPVARHPAPRFFSWNHQPGPQTRLYRYFRAAAIGPRR